MLRQMEREIDRQDMFFLFFLCEQREKPGFGQGRRDRDATGSHIPFGLCTLNCSGCMSAMTDELPVDGICSNWCVR